jgi:protein ImuA
MHTGKQAILQQLKSQIMALQGFTKPANTIVQPHGLHMMHAHLPYGSFPIGTIHEFLCSDDEDITATAGFITALISTSINSNGAIIWLQKNICIFPPALQQFGIDAKRIVFVNASTEKEMVWCIEEALQCNGIAAVIAEVNEINFTNSRRFQLAAEKTKVTGFLLNTKTKYASNTASTCKWQVKALPSNAIDDLPGVGYITWQVQLLKIKNGKSGCWQLIWQHNKFVNAIVASQDLAQTIKIAI